MKFGTTLFVIFLAMKAIVQATHFRGGIISW